MDAVVGKPILDVGDNWLVAGGSHKQWVAVEEFKLSCHS